MRTIILAGVMTLAVFMAPTAWAAGEKAQETLKSARAADRIAVVDMQYLVGKSKAGKSIETQVNKQIDSAKAEFAKIEKELGDLQKKLIESKASKKPEEFDAERKDFEKQLFEARNKTLQRRQAMERASNKAIGELRMEIVKIVADVADKGGYNIVVTKQNVIIAEKDMDITEQVLKQLDKQFPDIKVSFAPAADAKPDAKSN